MSTRSIQSTIEKFFNTTISFRLAEEWIKSFSKLLDLNVEEERRKESNNKNKPKTIEIVDKDEVRSQNKLNV